MPGAFSGRLKAKRLERDLLVSSNIRKQFGRQLQRLRRAEGMTQAELAEKAGLSDNHVGAIEHGLRGPSLDTIARLAKALDIQIWELFNFGTTGKITRSDAIKFLRRSLKGKGPEEIKVLADLAARLYQTSGVKSKGK